MIARFAPSSEEMEGKVKAPPSKSASHRLLIASALTGEKVAVSNVAFSEDIKATLDCLRALGCNVAVNGDEVTLDPSRFLEEKDAVLDCRESGSTLRFFVPLCLLTGGRYTLRGSERLLSRPLGVYAGLCNENGFTFENDGKKLEVSGRLKRGTYTIDGSVSSQFATGMLFALSRIGKCRLDLIPPVESRPYIDMTLSSLRVFGFGAEYESQNSIRVDGKTGNAPYRLEVEGDWSNAAFLDALNFVGANVEVAGLDAHSLQGDKIYKTHFESLGRSFCEIDLADTPDLAPVLMAAASLLHGARFTSTKRLRIKESDRGEAMKNELSKFGVRTDVREDEITVHPSKIHSPSAPLDGHNDHRIVMALSTLLLKTGGEIRGCEAVNKSYPDYFETLRKLKGKVGIYDS